MKHTLPGLVLSLFVLSGLGMSGTAHAATMDPLQPGGRIAFLGLTLLDTSAAPAYEGQRQDELGRMRTIEQLVRDRLTAEGFELVPIDPVMAELDRTTNPADCNKCEVRMGARLGADYVLVGEVQKVSELILSMNLVLRSVSTGAMARGRSVDIRGNTDESWQRGIRYILQNHFFPK